MLQIFREPKFKFMRLRVAGYALSGLILAASLTAVWMHKSRTGDLMNYGIDFRGGTLMQVRFASRPDVAALRRALTEAGFPNASIQAYGAAEENTVLIRVSEQLEETRDLVARIRTALRPAQERDREQQGLLDLNTAAEQDIAELLEQAELGQVSKSPDPVYLRVAREIVALKGREAGGLLTGPPGAGVLAGATPAMLRALGERCYTGSLSFLRTESVGPAVGKDLRSKALFASVVANGLILLYLWFRFELRFGVAAVLCQVHDVFFIVGVFALTDREFDLTVLAAILTVIGYSVNDTIVVFDRVRLNLKTMRKQPLEVVLDKSINQTLSRTVITTGLTLIVVVALFLYGGQVLNGFAFALLIGIVEGTYSSIFVASPLLLVWRRLFGE